MTEESRPCILYEDRPVCIHCGDCRCELEPEKICDNCMRCVREDADFRSVLIAGVEMDEADGQDESTEDQ